MHFPAAAEISHIITKPPALGTEEGGFPYIRFQSSSRSYSRCGSSSESTKIPVMTVNLWLVFANTFGAHWGTLGTRQWHPGSIWMWWLLPTRPGHAANVPGCAGCSQHHQGPAGMCITAPSLWAEFWPFVGLQPHKTVKLLPGAEVPAWPGL